MDVDPEYEFDCPKWYDFEREEDGESEERLDDSWFEREHPLHEPKDKEKNNRELKPLIEINEKTEQKKTNIPSTKNKIPKKSLGVKRSVRLARGNHGPAGRRKLPETTGLNQRSSSEKLKDSKDVQESVVDGQKSSKDDFSENRDFTPPWGFGSPSRPVTSEKDLSPKTALLNSPLRGPLTTPPVNSPKNTLFVKAINKAAGTGPKRRILPAIPCSNQNQEISVHLPLRGTSQSETPTAPLSVIGTSTTTKEYRDRSPIRDDHQKFNPVRFNSDSNNNDVISVDEKQGYVDQTSKKTGKNSPLSVEDLLKLHNQKVIASKSKYDSNGRRLQSRSVMPTVDPEGLNKKTSVMKTSDKDQESAEECPKEKMSGSPILIDNLDVISEERNTKSEGLKTESKNESQEVTAEVLLKLHNQRIQASKCKYDSNGRRIRTVNPAFCAAPNKNDVTDKPSLTRSKSRRSGASAAAGHTKLASSSDPELKVNTKLKQNRRSCVAEQTAQNINYGSVKQKVEGNNKNDGKISSTSTATIKSINSKSSTSNLKRNAIAEDEKCDQKNKRRSCVAAPVSSLSSGMSKGTGIAGQKRQKRRSCVASPQTPKRPGQDKADQDLKDLIARHNQRLAKNK